MCTPCRAVDPDPEPVLVPGSRFLCSLFVRDRGPGTWRFPLAIRIVDLHERITALIPGLAGEPGSSYCFTQIDFVPCEVRICVAWLPPPDSDVHVPSTASHFMPGVQSLVLSHSCVQ